LIKSVILDFVPHYFATHVMFPYGNAIVVVAVE